MPRHFVLAFDGSPEGFAALRAGAVLARRCDAQVVALAALRITSGPIGAPADRSREHQALMEQGPSIELASSFKSSAVGCCQNVFVIRGRPARPPRRIGRPRAAGTNSDRQPGRAV